MACHAVQGVRESWHVAFHGTQASRYPDTTCPPPALPLSCFTTPLKNLGFYWPFAYYLQIIITRPNFHHSDALSGFDCEGPSRGSPPESLARTYATALHLRTGNAL